MNAEMPSMKQLAIGAKRASRALASLEGAKKDAVLRAAAARIRGVDKDAIARANEEDLRASEADGKNAAFLDRLRLDGPRIDAMARSIDDIAALADPVGAIKDLARRPNGMLVGRMRVPLGVVAIIYESRPNVTAEAAALCLKSGNACILRGGREAFRTSQAIAASWTAALDAEGIPPAAVTLVPTVDREATLELIAQSGLVDLVIPRGGEGLIRFVTEHARVPVIQHYKGVCHVYVDEHADVAMADAIAFNAKVQRPGVCNAMETLLVHRAVAQALFASLAPRYREAGVELRGCDETLRLVPWTSPATDDDWAAEYLEKILAVRVVGSYEEAVEHVARWGSGHTEAIVTRDHGRAMAWLRDVDASCVVVNASTRFNDGGELGLGAEIGISTTKLHAYGPMGLEELCTSKWIVLGEGQVRS